MPKSSMMHRTGRSDRIPQIGVTYTQSATTTRFTQDRNIARRTRLLPPLLLALSAFAPAGCYSISGMEAVQAVQTPKNGVPMIALKPTFVRVYVRSVEVSHGPWHVDARLTVKDAVTGTQHELAPLNPGPITVATDGGQRDRWSGSFTLLLDRIDTYPGYKTLEARVFEVGGANPPRSETLTQVWTFHPPVYDSSYGVVWAVKNTDDNGGESIGPAAPWSDFAVHVAFAQNVYPVSGYGVVPLPGAGYAAPSPQPFNNLTESRTWASQMLANLPAGSKINLLDNWDTGGLHGYAWGLASEEQNARTGGRAGSVMAQEVSHNHGLWCHTFDVCTLYAQYPRKSGMIDAADIGFNVSGNFGGVDPQLVSRSDQRDAKDFVSVSGPTADYMSYSFPTWVSSFTYCLMIGELWKQNEASCTYAHSIEPSDVVRSGRKVREVTMTPLPRHGPPPVGEALFVAGYVDDAGRGKFAAAEVIPQAASAATEHEHGEFTIEILGADGASLGRVAVDLHSGHPQKTVPFSALLPSTLLTQRAAVIRLKKNEAVIAEQVLAKHAPNIELTRFPRAISFPAPRICIGAPRIPTGNRYAIRFSSVSTKESIGGRSTSALQHRASPSTQTICQGPTKRSSWYALRTSEDRPPASRSGRIA